LASTDHLLAVTSKRSRERDLHAARPVVRNSPAAARQLSGRRTAIEATAARRGEGCLGNVSLRPLHAVSRSRVPRRGHAACSHGSARPCYRPARGATEAARDLRGPHAGPRHQSRRDHRWRADRQPAARVALRACDHGRRGRPHRAVPPEPGRPGRTRRLVAPARARAAPRRGRARPRLGGVAARAAAPSSRTRPRSRKRRTGCAK
jgi:hypothetical protein